VYLSVRSSDWGGLGQHIGAVLAARLGQSVILGYIFAGVVIGPYTPGFVGDPTAVKDLAGAGIVLQAPASPGSMTWATRGMAARRQEGHRSRRRAVRRVAPSL
jgi:hypothetical protein